jgi:hypothetical protein
MMNEVLHALTVEQKLQLLEDLLPLVGNTCGRHNCNCPGSDKIRKVLDQHGVAPVVDNRKR